MMARDAIVTRNQARPRLRSAMKGPDSGNRQVTGFSRKSRATALRHLRNSTCYRTFAVLTFPGPVKDDREVKASLDRFAKRLLRLGISFFWKQEFYRSGNPHLHLLLTGQIEESTLQRLWAEAIETPTVHVFSEPIRSYEGAFCYLMKPCDHWQHSIPKGYRNMGRYWGTRGPAAKADVFLIVQGDASQVAALARPIRTLDRSKRKGTSKPRRDNGVAGKTFYDCGGPDVARALKSIVESASVDQAASSRPRLRKRRHAS